MTNAARDDRERDISPEANLTDLTYYTREPDGYGPDDYRWQPITDPAEIATIEGALAQGIDPPYEVWVDQAPAPLGPGDLTPAVADQTAYYSWEQTGPQPGDGQLYEVTDPVVIAAYAEAHPEPSGIEITNPADYYEAATAPEPAPSAALDRDLTPALDL